MESRTCHKCGTFWYGSKFNLDWTCSVCNKVNSSIAKNHMPIPVKKAFDNLFNELLLAIASDYSSIEASRSYANLADELLALEKRFTEGR